MNALREYEPAPGRPSGRPSVVSTLDPGEDVREYPAPHASFQESRVPRTVANDAAGNVARHPDRAKAVLHRTADDHESRLAADVE
ncbi:hypothetical protein [Saccharopolyspora gloriosae]|uniref:hypothetical protein n=1 Tax=Saccharopolyspora gloriosae TaxID=455344 RepID=UPI001FB84F5B|nr:hypothetical protein [Saccharopolyspora gloriosae]